MHDTVSIFLLLEPLEALGQGWFQPNFWNFCQGQLGLREQQRFDKADILELSYSSLNPMAQVTGLWPENISMIILQDYFKLRKAELSIDVYV